MGRRPKAATEAAATMTDTTEATTPQTTAAPVVRRRRRTNTVDHAAQTVLLVESLLKSRGQRGATHEEILAVVLWAQGIDKEEAEVTALAARVRRAKTENLPERQVALSLNKVLLEGVLAGTIQVDINEAGSITFR